MSARCLICDVEVDPQQPGSLVQRFTSYPPAYYCLKHANKSKAAKPSRPKPFRLTRDERAGIFAGEHPRLERGPDEYELVEGEVVELSASVWIGITRKGKNKKGRVQYRYTVHDQRLDSVRMLRRTPPALRPEIIKDDRVHPPTAGEIRQAAEDSAYASGGRRDTLISDAGEAPPRSYEAELSVRSRLRQAERLSSEISDGD